MHVLLLYLFSLRRGFGAVHPGFGTVHPGIGACAPKVWNECSGHNSDLTIEIHNIFKSENNTLHVIQNLIASFDANKVVIRAYFVG